MAIGIVAVKIYFWYAKCVRKTTVLKDHMTLYDFIVDPQGNCPPCQVLYS